MANAAEISLPESRDECGHFHMQLQLFNTSKAQLTTRVEDQIKHLDHYVTGTMRHCVYHMLGLLVYSQGKKEKALKHFKDVLNENGNNLNALANLEYIYTELGRDGEAGRYREILEEFFTNGEDKEQLVISISEKAFALAFDAYADDREEMNLHVRCKQSNEMYTFALAESETIEALQNERYKWMFLMAKNSFRVLSRTKNDKQRRWNLLNDSLPRLKHVVTTDNSDDYHKGQAWCHIGMFLYHGKPELAQKGKRLLEDTDLWSKFQNPMTCFEAAEKYGGINYKILTRTARYISFQEKQHRKALCLVNRSLDLNPDPKISWFAYSTRGQIYCTMYKELSRGYQRRNKYDAPDKALLVKAADDLRRSLKGISSPKNEADLAYALLQLGVTPSYFKFDAFSLADTGRMVSDTEQISEAMELFASAATNAPSDARFRKQYEETFHLLVASLFANLNQENDQASAETMVTRICDVMTRHKDVYQQIKNKQPTCKLRSYYPNEHRRISRELFRQHQWEL